MLLDVFGSWIEMILQSVKLLFGVNGSSVGYISCKKGVF